MRFSRRVAPILHGIVTCALSSSAAFAAPSERFTVAGLQTLDLTGSAVTSGRFVDSATVPPYLSSLPDLAIASPRANTQAGVVRLFNGITGQLIRTMNGSSPGSRFGESVARLNDITFDGIDDLLVGAPGESVAGQMNAGRVHLIDGATGQTLASYQSSLPLAGDRLGAAMAVFESLPTDALVLVSSTEDGGISTSGAAIANRPGKVDLLSVSRLPGGTYSIAPLGVGTLQGSQNGEKFGRSLELVRDSLGAPTALAVGAPRFNAAGGLIQAGRVAIYDMAGVFSTLTPTTFIDGIDIADEFGFSLTSCSDCGTNGSPAVFVGAPNADSVLGTTDVGNVQKFSLVSGTSGLSVVAQSNETIEGTFPSENLGFSTASVAGFSPTDLFQIAAGAPNAGGGSASISSGRVLLTNPNALVVTSINPTNPGQFGATLASLPALAPVGQIPSAPGYGLGVARLNTGTGSAPNATIFGPSQQGGPSGVSYFGASCNVPGQPPLMTPTLLVNGSTPGQQQTFRIDNVPQGYMAVLYLTRFKIPGGAIAFNSRGCRASVDISPPSLLFASPFLSVQGINPSTGLGSASLTWTVPAAAANFGFEVQALIFNPSTIGSSSGLEGIFTTNAATANF